MASEEGARPQEPAEELTDLQKRFHLLEGDRKAFYEKSQSELRENKEHQEALRSENKTLRAQLGKLQKEHASKDGGPGSELHAHELQKLEHQHNVLRQRHNALASGNRDREATIERLADELQDLQRDSKRPAKQESPLTRQIRILENRLDKAMIKYNEAQSIRKTYEQIVKRLREERVNFDHQLSAVEDTLRAKSSDYEELLLMSNDASHARDIAKQELAKQEAVALEEHKHRENELRSRRALVDTQKAVMGRMASRNQSRREAILEAKGDLAEDDEKRLREQVVATEVSRAVAEGAIADESQRMGQYEAAFRKIKESTGVNDLNEVINRFLTQENTLESLKHSTEQAQSRLDALTEERAQARALLEEIKYAGAAGIGGRQEMDAQERRLADAMTVQERAKARYERLAKALIDMRAGVEHLHSKIETATKGRPSDSGHDASGAAAANAAAGANAVLGMTDKAGGAQAGGAEDHLLDLLATCEQKLVRMVEQTNKADDLTAGVAGTSGDGGPKRRSPQTGMSLFDELLDPHNVRVSFGPPPEVEGEEGGEDDEDDDGDINDVPDRETLKKLHGVMLEKASAKGRRRRKPTVAHGVQGGRQD